ncbi:hypothetical protein LXA43DRAFT_884480 [Ganoderma leucocontextum]|nr:hypothetical protein LXA43DRAFT_884480 [Ganoderma leucocontextum]
MACNHGDENPCTVHDSGNYYDLSRLSASKDYEFTSSSGQKYILNVCKHISKEVWNPRVDKPEDVAGYTERAHGGFSMGDVNTTVLFREGNPVILMTDGSPCPNAGNLTASTAIRFICDSSAGAGKPDMIATLPPDEENACAFFVEWRTEMACPTSEGGVFGTIVSVLAIIVAVLFALYHIGGTLYNRYVLELQGVDQIPKFSFISFHDTVEFVRDCVDRVKCRSSDAWHSRHWGVQNWNSGGGSRVGSGGAGYGGLHSTAEEAETMLGGPPGWLDEQDEEDEDDEEAARHGPVPPQGSQSEEHGSRRPGMDGSGQQPQPMHDDDSQNFVPSQYAMYSPSEDGNAGYLVYSQMQQPGYPPVVQHPGAPPRQMSDSDLQQAMQYHRSIHMMPPQGQHFGPAAPGVYTASPPHDTSADGIYHSRNSSATGSPASSRGTSLVHRHPLRYDPTPSPTSSVGRRSRGHSISDDDDRIPMGGVAMAESLANTRKEATRRQRIEAEQRRRDELRDGYARLKDVLPVSNQKSSKVSLLERATNHIVNLEKTNRQLQQRLATLESEVSRLRALNEKISLGVNNTPSPGQVNMDSRPLSPPPEGTQSQTSNIDQPLAESSPSSSENGY